MIQDVVKAVREGRLNLNSLYTASFDVDAQNGFTPLCPGELPVTNGHEIVDELNKQATFASIRVGSKDAHPLGAFHAATYDQPQFSPVSGFLNIDIRWNVHCVPGTFGFQLIKGLPKWDEYHFFVWKGIEPDAHPYGACYHDLHNKRTTGVIEFLKANHIETVIVGGLATDYCIKTTVLQLLGAGFAVILNLGACRGISNETTGAAIDQMHQKGAYIILNAGQLNQEENWTSIVS